MTGASKPTETRPTATEVKPCPMACETTPSRMTIVEPSALCGSKVSPRSIAAMASATAETAADQSVAVGPSSCAHPLDDEQVAGVGDRRAKGEYVAKAKLRRGGHPRHRPGAEQRQRERDPNPRRRMLGKEQGAARHRENRRDIADERGVGDFRSGQRNVEGSDVSGEGETSEQQQERRAEGRGEADCAAGG